MGPASPDELARQMAGMDPFRNGETTLMYEHTSAQLTGKTPWGGTLALEGDWFFFCFAQSTKHTINVISGVIS